MKVFRKPKAPSDPGLRLSELVEGSGRLIGCRCVQSGSRRSRMARGRATIQSPLRTRQQSPHLAGIDASTLQVSFAPRGLNSIGFLGAVLKVAPRSTISASRPGPNSTPPRKVVAVVFGAASGILGSSIERRPWFGWWRCDEQTPPSSAFAFVFGEKRFLPGRVRASPERTRTDSCQAIALGIDGDRTTAAAMPHAQGRPGATPPGKGPAADRHPNGRPAKDHERRCSRGSRPRVRNRTIGQVRPDEAEGPSRVVWPNHLASTKKTSGSPHHTGSMTSFGAQKTDVRRAGGVTR